MANLRWSWIIFELTITPAVGLLVALPFWRKGGMAALSCAFFPFGTVLGVFTIIVLQKDSVRQLFGRT